MSGQDKAPQPPHHPVRRPADPDSHLPAGGPRHMKTSPDFGPGTGSGPGPEQWATHRLVSIAARLHERRLNQRLARYKLTTSALDAMEAVAELRPATATNVAAMLCVSRQSLGKVLRRLQSLKLLTKEPARDGRSAYLRLTPEGQEVLGAAEDLIREETETESAHEYEFRYQLEQHIRRLRNTERASATWHPAKEPRARTEPVSIHGQEQRTSHFNQTGAPAWPLQQTGLPEPTQTFKKQPRQ